MSTEHTEHERTFTQEQQQAMYKRLQEVQQLADKIEAAILNAQSSLTYFDGTDVIMCLDAIDNTLQALATSDPVAAAAPNTLSKLFHLIDILDLGDSQAGTECENCGTRYSQQILCPQCGKPYNWTLSDYQQHETVFAWFADNVNHIRMIATPQASQPAQGLTERPMYGVRFTHGKWYVWHEWGNYAWQAMDSEHEAQTEADRLNARANGEQDTGG